MQKFIIKGFSFGLTSGIITTLGMMIGLSSGTESMLAVIGGILTVAVADAFSDAFGINMSEKSGNDSTVRQVWEATFATFFGKIFFGLTFLIPVLLLDLRQAIYVSVAWGLFVLGAISYWIARDQKKSALAVIAEHWVIAGVVISATHFLGLWINHTFNV